MELFRGGGGGGGKSPIEFYVAREYEKSSMEFNSKSFMKRWMKFQGTFWSK